MIKQLAEILDDFDSNGMASAEAVESVEREMTVQLPIDYKAFMAARDGGEGFIGSQYFILWCIGRLVDLNRDYEVEKYAPGLVFFGSNGGGEAFAFDTRAKGAIGICRVPFIGMSLGDAQPMADTFKEFLIRLAEADGPSIRPGQQRPQDLELFFITPIILGGSPNAPENITYLERRQHIDAVRYWNRIIADLRKKQAQ